MRTPEEIAYSLQSYGKGICWHPVIRLDSGSQQRLHELLTEAAEALCIKPAAALGRMGGSRNTRAQNAARKRNGKLGGRPRNPKRRLQTPPPSGT